MSQKNFSPHLGQATQKMSSRTGMLSFPCRRGRPDRSPPGRSSLVEPFFKHASLQSPRRHDSLFWERFVEGHGRIDNDPVATGHSLEEVDVFVEAGPRNRGPDHLLLVEHVYVVVHHHDELELVGKDVRHGPDELTVLFAALLDGYIAGVTTYTGMRHVHGLYAGEDALDLAIQATFLRNAP